MKNKFILLSLACLSLVGCAAQNPVRTTEVPVAMVTPEEPLPTSDAIRTPEVRKAYPVGRYIDPNDPGVMHERHEVYRVEQSPSWDLRPNAPATLPLGPVTAVSNPATQSNPLTAEFSEELQKQKMYTFTIIKQNEALSQKLETLNREAEQNRELARQNADLKQQVSSLSHDVDDLKHQVTQAAEAAKPKPTPPHPSLWDQARSYLPGNNTPEKSLP